MYEDTVLVLISVDMSDNTHYMSSHTHNALEAD